MPTRLGGAGAGLKGEGCGEQSLGSRMGRTGRCAGGLVHSGRGCFGIEESAGESEERRVAETQISPEDHRVGDPRSKERNLLRRTW